jgi:hypothetical protein
VQAAEPRQWIDHVYGKVNQMETTGIQRARQLRDLYKGLQMTELSKAERLAMLETVKATVKVGLTRLILCVASIVN